MGVVRTMVEVLIESGGRVELTYIPKRIVTRPDGTQGVDYPAALHIHLGGVNLYGRPEEVLRFLYTALAKSEAAERDVIKAGYRIHEGGHIR